MVVGESQINFPASVTYGELTLQVTNLGGHDTECLGHDPSLGPAQMSLGVAFLPQHPGNLHSHFHLHYFLSCLDLVLHMQGMNYLVPTHHSCLGYGSEAKMLVPQV